MHNPARGEGLWGPRASPVDKAKAGTKTMPPGMWGPGSPALISISGTPSLAPTPSLALVPSSAWRSSLASELPPPEAREPGHTQLVILPFFLSPHSSLDELLSFSLSLSVDGGPALSSIVVIAMRYRSMAMLYLFLFSLSLRLFERCSFGVGWRRRCSLSSRFGGLRCRRAMIEGADFTV